MINLRKAAEAVIARWDSPDWKDSKHTADYINALRSALAEPEQPTKWTQEEIDAGYVGIRWVASDGIHGRPTEHDVREYLMRTPSAHGCQCEDCKQFYTRPATPLMGKQIDNYIRGTGIDEREDLCSFSFHAGVRWAEREHRIGVKK